MEGFNFKKKFGQNFLSDVSLLTEIVEKSGVMSDDVVVEIGAGRGALTEVLSKNAKKVFSFELDKDLFDLLQEKFENTNVNLIFKDVMQVSDKEINSLTGGKFKLVANLPYYITSPIITRFLKNKNLTSLTVMVQEEVADRIIAEPKTKDYGVLSVICQIYGSPEKVLRVNRNKFYPVPNVDSAVVRIDRRENDFDYDDFISFVKRAFAMRRKKLSSNLEGNGMSKNQIETLLSENGYNPLSRAEEFSVEELFAIFNLFYSKKA